MGLLSSSVSVTRYRVEGKLENPVLENVANRLKQHIIGEIDGDVPDKAVGWTSFERPFEPNFDGSSFVIGAHLVFSLRVDKKNIPTRVIKKNYAIEAAKFLSEGGRQYLTRQEKRMVRERVENVLAVRIPAIPNIYDVAWNYETASLWFFSNSKSANEVLETLFSKTFNLRLIRLFPFTMAEFTANLSGSERDQLTSLSPTNFTG